jgi:hypothetical protein
MVQHPWMLIAVVLVLATLQRVPQHLLLVVVQRLLVT